MYEVRRIKSSEVQDALKLVHDVFLEFEAPDYKHEGVDTFLKFINDPKVISDFQNGICPMYCAIYKGQIIGVIGMREGQNHINLTFVKKEHHRKGIASSIFRYIINEIKKEKPEISEITVNSSPYGLQFYLHIGFVKLSEEIEKDGIRFIPMKFIIDKS